MNNSIRLALVSFLISVACGAIASTHRLEIHTTLPPALAILHADGSPLKGNFAFKINPDSTFQPVEIPVMFVSNDPSVPLHLSVSQSALVARNLRNVDPIPLLVKFEDREIGARGLRLEGKKLASYPFGAAGTLKVSVERSRRLFAAFYEGRLTVRLYTGAGVL